MKLTKNFSLSEFACKDGTQVPVEYYGNVQLLAKQLQVIREEVGALNVVSGYRTKSHNEKVKGAPNSAHRVAKASDLKSAELSPEQLYEVIVRLITEGKIRNGGLSLYPKFVHYDVATPRRW